MKLKYGMFFLVFMLIFTTGLGESRAFASNAVDTNTFYPIPGNGYWTNECGFVANPTNYPLGPPKVVWCEKMYYGERVGGYVSIIDNTPVWNNLYWYQGNLYPLNGGPIVAPTKVKVEEESEE